MLLDIHALSQRLSLSESVLYQWVSQKKIPHLKIGRSLRFDSDEIEKWLEKQKIGAQDPL